ncbi:SulP family inorganic anion transporter [Ekhidna sp. MALMAid0563]|uniref:SulP family inorganic anion transporter n=1 Tax=Ekhidna sp. MALMAid0563 TaxID=3143937 RepID=UPI0032DF2B79
MNTLLDKKPLTGVAGLKAHWKDDLLSGFMVSLIALPLCLGIALASGVPPMAGLTAAIVGGMLMSRITGSYVTISGPAAGLIVVTLGAVESMGAGDPLAGYKFALAAIVVAGLIQVGFGMLKVGKLGDFFPSAAVHGMLAAIGVIIMIKQFFVALGTKAEGGGHGLFHTISQIPEAFVNMNPEIALIAMVSLFILVGHPRVNFKPIKMIPAPMWVIIVTIPLSHLFDLFHEHHYNLVGNDYVIGPKYLVHLPDSIVDGIVFPDFGMIGTGAFWIAVVSIALVSSIESLLSASAVDTLDPYKRKSNLNRDMASMGGGSAISGFVGGLPMISEIVRSSANITNGAKTQWANFFHGTFLLIFLLFGKPIIEQIPLAALAAMLIHVGFKLAAPTEFKHVWEIGKEQLLIFVTTLLMVLATDLIIGIAAGILMKLILHLFHGAPLRYLFRTKLNYIDNEENEDVGTIQLHHSAIFSNYLSLKKEIESHYDKGHLILDFKNVNLIDHTFRTHLHELKDEWEKEGKKLELKNKEHLIAVSDHPLAAKVAGNNTVGYGEKLNSHQIELLDISKSNWWNFEPGKTMSFEDFRDFSFSRSGRISYAQNLISGSFENYRFIFAEVVYDTDLRTKAATDLLPALIIKPEGNNATWPVFTMEKEGFFERVTNMANSKDIDFDDHPVFSDKFLLKGPNEDEVRKFFKPTVLQFIESNPIYHLESNGPKLIIYRFDKKKKEKEVAELIRFGKRLVMTIDKY